MAIMEGLQRFGYSTLGDAPIDRSRQIKTISNSITDTIVIILVTLYNKGEVVSRCLWSM
jgi:hypothetical protein